MPAHCTRSERPSEARREPGGSDGGAARRRLPRFERESNFALDFGFTRAVFGTRRSGRAGQRRRYMTYSTRSEIPRLIAAGKVPVSPGELRSA